VHAPHVRKTCLARVVPRSQQALRLPGETERRPNTEMASQMWPYPRADGDITIFDRARVTQRVKTLVPEQPAPALARARKTTAAEMVANVKTIDSITRLILSKRANQDPLSSERVAPS